MINVTTFFRERAQQWRRENSNRAEDYIFGGVVALREAADTLAAHKDMVGIDRLAAQQRATEKENREVQQRNAKLNQQLREMTTKFEKANVELGLALQELEARPKPTVASGALVTLSMPESTKKKSVADLRAENNSLRYRIGVLESQLKQVGCVPVGDPKSELANHKAQLAQLRQKLDEATDTYRAGAHIVSLSRVLKTLRRIVGWASMPDDERMQHVARLLANTQAVMAGREPENWEGPTLPSDTNIPAPAAPATV